MRHENIQSFLAADVIQRSSHICYYLIAQYHNRGTLYDYLQTTVLDVYSMIMLAHSVANGLAHLHGPISDERGDKPAIVHRNLNSSSIYVKADGKSSFKLLFNYYPFTVIIFQLPNAHINLYSNLYPLKWSIQVKELNQLDSYVDNIKAYTQLSKTKHLTTPSA